MQTGYTVKSGRVIQLMGDSYHQNTMRVSTYILQDLVFVEIMFVSSPLVKILKMNKTTIRRLVSLMQVKWQIMNVAYSMV